MRYTVINNRGMYPVATTQDMPTALAWAETVPAHADFTIVSHTAHDLRPYRQTELRLLHARLTDTVSRPLRAHLTYEELTARVLEALATHTVTTQLPPARSRVAPLTNDEDYDMATTKKTRSKKATTKKAPAKKTTARKAPAKKVAASKAPATGGKRVRYAGHKIVVVDKEHGAREGTKRARAMDLLLKCKTTDEALPQLIAMGADPSYIRFAMGGFGGKQLIKLEPME